MISVKTWLLYFYMLKIQNVLSVRIFQNTFPTPAPQIKMQFEASVLKKSCLLKPQHGPCRADIEMYYFDPATKNCTTFVWGGCQGNGNRHESFDGCLSYCLSVDEETKSRPHWCSLTFDYGYCFGSVTRYYYDNLWKVCKSTIYSGCGGNRNNFYSREQCNSICLYGNGPIIIKKVIDLSNAKKQLIINPTTIAKLTIVSAAPPAASNTTT